MAEQTGSQGALYKVIARGCISVAPPFRDFAVHLAPVRAGPIAIS
jgi:hypothetical protein